MTNAAKWKAFLRWWEEFQDGRNQWGVITYAVNNKIKELQKGDNAKQ